jgi:hypothetical protein
LGYDDRTEHIWPSQGDVAPLAGVTRRRISQILADALARWKKDPAITAVREQIGDLLEARGGVMSADELCHALLAARGSVEDEPRRSRLAQVVTRAAVETENAREEPKYIFRRTGNNVLIAVDVPIADYAVSLGQKADELAKEDPLTQPISVSMRFTGRLFCFIHNKRKCSAVNAASVVRKLLPISGTDGI